MLFKSIDRFLEKGAFMDKKNAYDLVISDITGRLKSLCEEEEFLDSRFMATKDISFYQQTRKITLLIKDCQSALSVLEEFKNS